MTPEEMRTAREADAASDDEYEQQQHEKRIRLAAETANRGRGTSSSGATSSKDTSKKRPAVGSWLQMAEQKKSRGDDDMDVLNITAEDCCLEPDEEQPLNEWVEYYDNENQVPYWYNRRACRPKA